ncbi:major facilitator superfamily arabinose transmembrane efflux protein [Gluconobacter thailandicus F149-1 = NBRC 100600]|uniref:Transmembrane efflux protein n=1 Tax=Gluconobacter thailandicus NBRC 3257 TaxID=1381097 RepID=A0ABQ0J0K0_GLUTH|nr:MFS transporter [Gluconobacter thailandicus]GAN89255.1 major facilitator superfamily arabinose transmembrane efflux protein [Gluconobacter frateurii M-2]KXV52495.1 MFS transporter [Gluconobacter thailandicus]GAC87146.1 transmembrane efflux protein [Gluconobacter thailandicus NBRC 3255]GAD27333.1 transmembrane efflux protein [Gluconobacter thailandicus NBRC 3257]GAN92599.1 major facilitator superfamily arabinose transmembrane efflux protein [Gluconobacter thailandicus F149-1 = NBRC 100600]
MNWPLLALAVGAFAIGTTEFTPMGLLPVIAQGLQVTVPKAGGLVTAYAVGVMAGAPFITLLLARLRRKSALTLLMGIYVAGNLLSAVAGSYELLFASRVLTSLAHGAFFGLGAVEASAVVAPERRASAVATMFMGLTIANIIGVPAATWLGMNFGWHMAFGVTAVLGLLTMVAVQWALPAREAGPVPDVGSELKALLRANVLLALVTTAIGAGAMFVLYTYIAPILQHITHASPLVITIALMLTGVGFSIGNAIGGRSADRSLDGSLLMFFPILGAVMLLFPWAAQTVPGALIATLVWGAATFALMPALQMRVMQAAHDAPALASSVNIGAFNLGNAIGAAFGGIALSMGLGYAGVSVIGTALALVGVGLVLFSRKVAPP